MRSNFFLDSVEQLSQTASLYSIKGRMNDIYIRSRAKIKIFVLSIFEWPLKTGFTVIGINVTVIDSMLHGEEFLCVGPEG